MDVPEGFADFVSRHQRPLLRAAWLLAGEWTSAEDLVQNSLASVWPRWQRIGPDDAQRLAYIHRVLVTRCMRDRRRRWSSELPTAVLSDAGLEFAQTEEARADIRRDLVCAMADLPPRQRAAIVLRYFVDLTEADTAAAMGCSVGAVKSHTHKAISRLRQMPVLAVHDNEEVP